MGIWEVFLCVSNILCAMYYYYCKSVSFLLMSSSTTRRDDDVIICDVTKRDVRKCRINFSIFSNVKKNMIFFIFWQWTHLAYKINPIKFHKERSNVNTVNISFCKMAVTSVKFVIKYVKWQKRHNWLPYPH